MTVTRCSPTIVDFLLSDAAFLPIKRVQSRVLEAFAGTRRKHPAGGRRKKSPIMAGAVFLRLSFFSLLG
jgi:hypothetical protein